MSRLMRRGKNYRHAVRGGLFLPVIIGVFLPIVTTENERKTAFAAGRNIQRRELFAYTIKMKTNTAKRRLCLLLCLAAVCCALPFTSLVAQAQAEEPAEAVNAFELHREWPLIRGKLGSRLGDLLFGLFGGKSDPSRPTSGPAGSVLDEEATRTVCAEADGASCPSFITAFSVTGARSLTVETADEKSLAAQPTGVQSLAKKAKNLPSTLCAGGQTFGVRLFAEGVMIVGVGEDNEIHPAYDAGVREQDILLAVDGKRVRCADDVKNELEKATGAQITLTCLRRGVKMDFVMTPYRDEHGQVKAGIFLRDSLAGIGTVTYFDPATGAFGGLGHGISHGASGRLMPLSRGAVLDVQITQVVRGECGRPGELRGYLKAEKQGVLLKNTDCGVFGVFSPAPKGGQTFPVGRKEELHPGNATLLCALGGEDVRAYAVRIGAIDGEATDSKCFSITVEDPELLRQTGGIIQGMSGSPIIQDGKLVGAVTHVLVGDPAKGYGIFIENMLAAAE